MPVSLLDRFILLNADPIEPQKQGKEKDYNGLHDEINYRSKGCLSNFADDMKVGIYPVSFSLPSTA